MKTTIKLVEEVLVNGVWKQIKKIGSKVVALGSSIFDMITVEKKDIRGYRTQICYETVLAY